MKEINFFITRTPLQLFNAIEAKKRFHKTDVNILFYQYQREIDKKLMENLIETSEWSEVISYPLTVARRIVFPFYLIPITRKYKQINHCYVGAFNSIVNRLINTIKPHKIIILDDGVKTLSIANNVASGTANKENNRVKTFRNNLFNLGCDYLYRASFFTIYTLEGSNIDNTVILNDYREFKHGLNSAEKKDVVYFIGTNLQEKILRSKNCLEEYVQQVLAYYTDRKFIYILHRYEDFEYLKVLAQKYDFDVVKFENILEVEIAKAGFIPAEFATFGSSAIETLPLLFSQSHYRIFKIKEKDIVMKKQLAMRNVYINFEKKGYTVISL